MNSYTKVIIAAVSIAIVLTALVFSSWSAAVKQNGTIVIPAGNTYLGPNAPKKEVQQPTSMFTIKSDTQWHTIQSTKYPYSFSVPTTLPLIQPEGDNPYDLWEISWGGYDPTSTVLISLDYKADPKVQKADYVRNWWQQFSGLKAAASIEPFTNSKGLKGFKARYVNEAGETPNLDVFFEVPGHTNYVIHLANGILDPPIFDKIVDSVSWGQ